MNPRCLPRTMVRSTLLLLALLTILSNSPGVALAQMGQPKKQADTSGITPPPQDINLLSMEVNALRTLYLLRGTNPDLAVGTQSPFGHLNGIVLGKTQFAACAEKNNRKREPAKVSDAYRKVLIDLRAAFIAEEVEKIEKLDKKLQDLQKAEEPELDDGIELTPEARKAAGAFVKQRLSADQVVAYLASYGKDLPNPRTLLFNAMRVTSKGPKGGTFGTKPSPEEWKALREFTIREVSWQIGGLDLAKGERTAEAVGQLLDKAYAMSEEELKENNLKLRGEARTLTDPLSPTDLIRFIMERDTAELLSNPRLVSAAAARLKYLATTEK